MLQRITILFLSIILLKALEAIWCGGEWTGRCPKFHVCLQANPKNYASHKCIEHEKNEKYPTCTPGTCQFPIVCCLARNRSSYCSADPSCFDELNGNFTIEANSEDGDSVSEWDPEDGNPSNDSNSQNRNSTIKSDSENENSTVKPDLQNVNSTYESDSEDENSTIKSGLQDGNLRIVPNSQNVNSTTE